MLNLSRIQSIGEALLDTAIAHKSNVALIEADREREKERFTYAEFKKETERFAALLQKHHIRPGDRVALLMSNQSKWLLSATAVFWSGCTLVPLDYKLTPEEQLKLLEHCQPKALIVEYPIWNRLKKLWPAEHAPSLFVSEAPEKVEDAWMVRWETNSSQPFTFHKSSREDVATIVYSSGTGGTAKGCMLTHSNYLAQAESLSKLYPMKEDELWFSILPTNHAIDFMCGYILPLLFGSTIVHQRALRPEFLASTIKRYGITHMALVPMILKALKSKFEEKFSKESSSKRNLLQALISINSLATLKSPRHRLSRLLLKPIHDQLGGRLKFFFAGGSFVDPKAADFFYQLGIPVVIGYGLTEAGAVLTVNDLKPYRSDTVGKPVSGTEIEIRNPNDSGVGEVWAKGPTVMKGYFKEPELTQETLIHGWLKTGDVGQIDASGHLKLVGRTKNMIVTEGGKNIYPEDVEVHLDNVLGLSELCVFSSSFVWPSGKLTEEKLFAVVKPKADSLDKEWLSSLQDRNRSLADYKRLQGYLVWDQDFPRTASMKVKRNLLAEELRNRFSKPDAIERIS